MWAEEKTMTKLNIELDTSTWEQPYYDGEYGPSSEGETFEQFLMERVADNIAKFYISKMNLLESGVIEKITKDIEAKAIKNLGSRTNRAVSRVLHGKEYGREKITLPEVIGNAINSWMTNSHSYAPVKITSLPEMMNQVVMKELSKETETILKEVKDGAIEEARNNIARMVSVELFDGKNLLQVQPPIPRT